MLKNNCLLEINTEVFKGGVIGYLGFILRLQQQKLNWERGIVKQNQQTIDNNYCRVMVTHRDPLYHFLSLHVHFSQ